MDLLNELLNKEIPSASCPNYFPRLPPTTHRLAVVGDAPHADDVVAREPFSGTAGRLLRAILGGCGIATSQVFYGNILQVPLSKGNRDGSDWELVDLNSPDAVAGLERLREDLSKFRPNCILLLGKSAFHVFHPDLCYQTRKGFVIPTTDWRGSIQVSLRFENLKTVTCHHPSFILRSYADLPFFKFDVARAVKQSTFPDLRLLERNGNLRPILEEVLTFIEGIRSQHLRATFDIEGYADDVGVTMLSICTSPSNGIVIPFWVDSYNFWSVEEEVQVWQAFAGLMYDASVPKAAHNAFYELFVLAWRHRIVINNLADDTMMLHWELFPEAAGDPNESDTGKKKRAGIGRSLADCCSIYTEQPYYKGGRLSDSTDVKLRYNLTDSQVTDEIIPVVKTRLTPTSLAHYHFNINIIPAVNYIMLRGCKLDVEKLRGLRATVAGEIATLDDEINSVVLQPACDAGVVTRKRKSDPFVFNCDSGNQLRWLLFTHLKYKPLKKYETDTGKDGTSEDVLLHYWTREQNPLVRLIIRCVRKRTRISDINKLLPNADGRIRSSFDIVGTNTGRLSSRKSIALELIDGEWTNTGTNLQNVTKDLRSSFIPDTLDRDFWQFDLSGADGWTVAADLAALGHPAMLDDYLYGIKPALVLYYMLQEHNAGRPVAAVNRLDRSQLKVILNSIKHEMDIHEGELDSEGRLFGWEYHCCKAIQHGTNYGAQPDKIAEIIFGQSDGTIVLSKSQATLMQSFYCLRYNPAARNERIRRTLSDTGCLIAACGIRRAFLGIRNRREIDDATIREAAAFEPQANTTWATNKALERLWYDPANRTQRGGLFIEPLLQIHDAIAGQYRSHTRAWAGEKLTSYFNNPLIICGQKIVIPAAGGWGTDWKNTNNKF